MALTGQFSAASRIFSTVSPAGSTASDWRLSLRRNTLGAIVLAHHLVPHFELLRGEPLDRLDRRVIAQALLGRPFGPARRVFLVKRPLVGMLDERQGAVADQVDRRLVACQQ